MVFPAQIKNQQTAARICISVKTNNSSSYSNTASLMRTERLSTFELLYNNFNQPLADAVETMNQHHGTTWLILDEDGHCIEGHYYSGRGRQNFGKITFIRENKL
jgi:N-formylglutamate amidohydrolase